MFVIVAPVVDKHLLGFDCRVFVARTYCSLTLFVELEQTNNIVDARERLRKHHLFSFLFFAILLFERAIQKTKKNCYFIRLPSVYVLTTNVLYCLRRNYKRPVYVMFSLDNRRSSIRLIILQIPSWRLSDVRQTDRNRSTISRLPS